VHVRPPLRGAPALPRRRGLLAARVPVPHLHRRDPVARPPCPPRRRRGTLAQGGPSAPGKARAGCHLPAERAVTTMPTRAPRACGKPGCPNVRPCPLHPASWAEGQRGRAMPPGWAATRERVLVRDRRWCRSCCSAPATEVHHLRPGTEGDEWLVSLCSACHLRATQAQAAAARRAERASAAVPLGARNRTALQRPARQAWAPPRRRGDAGQGPGQASGKANARSALPAAAQRWVGGNPSRGARLSAVIVAARSAPSLTDFGGRS
jgi:5-methylcytosine-specific restriction endonuclease McrA